MNSDKTKPDYYQRNGFDLLEALAKLAPIEGYRWIMKFNIIKYVIRYDNKNGLEDLEKASEYLSRLIEYETQV